MIGSLPGPRDSPGQIVKGPAQPAGRGTLVYALVTTTELVATDVLGHLWPRDAPVA